MECLYCHSQVPEDATFCQNCGAQEFIRPVDTIGTIASKKGTSSASYDTTPRRKKKYNCSTLILILFIVSVIFIYRYFDKSDSGENNIPNTDQKVSETVEVDTPISEDNI